jgi:ankyrin repeat protein
MEEDKDLIDKKPKKTFQLINYEEKYKKECQISDLLLKDRFEKCRGELGITSLEQLQDLLKGAKSCDSYVDYDTRVPTRPDGNCAYNAAALGICDLIISGQLPESVASKKLLALLTSVGNVCAQNTLLSHIDNKNEDDRQKLLAPHLRTLAVDYIREQYQFIYQEAFEVNLQDEYDSFKQTHTVGEMFCIHRDIKEKFDTLATFDELLQWWNETGKEHYFNRIRLGGSSRSQWGSEIELDAIAVLFGINIRVESVTINSSLSTLCGLKYGRLDDTLSLEQKNLLWKLNVCDKKSGQYYLSVKSKKEVEETIKKLDDSICDAVRNCVIKSNEVGDRDCSESLSQYILKLRDRGIVSRSSVSTYTLTVNYESKLQQIAPELRQKVEFSLMTSKSQLIKTSRMFLPFSAHEISVLLDHRIIWKCGVEEKYLLLGENNEIDEEGIELRLNGFPELLDKILKCLKTNIPEFKVRNDGAHWEYYRRQKRQEVKTENLNKSELTLRTYAALEKNKIFQALKYCIRGLKVDKNFMSGGLTKFLKKWNICIITLNNLSRENEILESVEELSFDHLLIRKEEKTEIIATFDDTFALFSFLKDCGVDVKFHKILDLSVLGIAALFDHAVLMGHLAKEVCIPTRNNRDVIEGWAIAAEYHKQNILTYFENENHGLILRDKNGHCSLYFSVDHEFTNAIRYLIKRNTKLDYRDMKALKLAALHGKFEIFKIMVEYYSSSNSLSKGSLRRCIVVTENIDIVRCSLSHHKYNELINSAMFLSALLRGKREEAKLYIEVGMNPNSISWNKSCPLLDACIHGDVEIVRLLIKAGGDPNLSLDRIKDDGTVFYDRPLTHSFKRGHLPVVKCIIEEAMTLGIALSHDGLSQDQIELVARFQQEVEMEHRLKNSTAVISQRPSFLADSKQAPASMNSELHDQDKEDQGNILSKSN